MEAAELVEIEAYGDMFAAAPPDGPARLARSGGALAVQVVGAPLPELNRIVGLSSMSELEAL